MSAIGSDGNILRTDVPLHAVERDLRNAVVDPDHFVDRANVEPNAIADSDFLEGQCDVVDSCR